MLVLHVVPINAVECLLSTEIESIEIRMGAAVIPPSTTAVLCTVVTPLVIVTVFSAEGHTI